MWIGYFDVFFNRLLKVKVLIFDFSNGKKITSYSFKIFIFLSPAIFYPSLVLLGSASAVV